MMLHSILVRHKNCLEVHNTVLEELTTQVTLLEDRNALLEGLTKRIVALEGRVRMQELSLAALAHASNEDAPPQKKKKENPK